MEAVKEYLFGVTVAALCSGILVSILGKKGMAAGTVKFFCGIVMLLAVMGPLVNIRLGSLGDVLDDISLEAESAAAFGQDSAQKEYCNIIKQRTAAYILDKAETLGAELTVEVTLNDEVPPVPCAVRLCGVVTPYAKKVLSETISRDLGIKTEEQTWIG